MQQNAFPVIDSTLSPEHLAGWVSEKYGFREVSCRLLKTNMNHSYTIVAGGTKYILRVYTYKHRDMQMVSEECRLLDGLKHSINVSYPVPGLDGELVYLINAPEGERCVVLFSFAEGKKLRYMDAATCGLIGVEMGKLHRITQNQSLNRTKYDTGKLIEWAYEQAVQYISPELDEMKMVKSSSAVLASALGKTTLRRGIVHLDIWYDNMSVQEDGTITLFDFDNCGDGWLILDLGYYCMQLYFIEQDKAEYEQKKAAFIEGYGSVITVSDKELELIPYAGLFVWIYYLGVQSQRFDNFGNIFLSENYVKMFIGRAKDWLKYHGIEIA